jgi:hypothetical protein
VVRKVEIKLLERQTRSLDALVLFSGFCSRCISHVRDMPSLGEITQRGKSDTDLTSATTTPLLRLLVVR